jgi:hypothetical protein
MKLLVKNLPYLLIALTLIACGGKGNSNNGNGSAGISLGITVATGAPVIGATVTVVDSKGNSENCSSTTSSSGQLTCLLTTAVSPPYLIRAQQLSNILYAVVPDSLSSNINVTPISDAMAKKFTQDNALTPAQIFNNPGSMPSSATSARDAVQLINKIVELIATQAGLTVSNPLTQTYNPTNTAGDLDRFIHNIVFNSDSSTINISIPTNTGTVSVNIAFSSSPTNVSVGTFSPNLADGNAIDVTIDRFLNDLKTCSQSAIQDMLTLSSGTYFSGKTLANWVASTDNCPTGGSGNLVKKSSKIIARFADKAVQHLVVQDASGNLFEFDLNLIKNIKSCHKIKKNFI